jgi:hypothetical protein
MFHQHMSIKQVAYIRLKTPKYDKHITAETGAKRKQLNKLANICTLTE